jgi:hypothetical protein
MTLFMISGMMIFTAIVFLLRCLNAFSHELKRSKGAHSERPLLITREVFKQNARRVIQMQRQHAGDNGRAHKRRGLAI